MVLTSNVSPPGVYSLRIVASTGGEHIIFYNITTESTQSKTSLTKTQANTIFMSVLVHISSSNCTSIGGSPDKWVSSSF